MMLLLLKIPFASVAA